MKFNTSLIRFATIGLGLFALASCTKNIPTDLDALGDDIVYNTNEFKPILGRNIFYSNIVSIGQSTTQPVDFKIVNVRDIDGQPATVFLDKFPVKVWKQSYTGFEKSIEEIENKRKIEYRPILEILEKSGNINFWGTAASSSFIKAQPDSGYVFDIEVSSSGGRKYIRNFKLKPYREIPYEPTILDPISGLSPIPYTYPAQVQGMVGARTGRSMGYTDINIYFNKLDTKTTGPKTLTISFLDSLNNQIDPIVFNATDWSKSVHGFNKRIENKKVTYDVAYPIPLAPVSTDYTYDGGELAFIRVKYRRLGSFGLIQDCYFDIPYAIHEEGNWEIQVRFPKESPKFD